MAKTGKDVEPLWKLDVQSRAAIALLNETKSESSLDASAHVAYFTQRVAAAVARNHLSAPATEASLMAMGLQPGIAKQLVQHVGTLRMSAPSVDAHPSITSFRWRVDVGISSSETALSELRYNSAKVLAEMVAVHAHPVLKIT